MRISANGHQFFKTKVYFCQQKNLILQNYKIGPFAISMKYLFFMVESKDAPFFFLP